MRLPRDLSGREHLNGPTLDRPLEIQGIIPYRTWRELIDGGSCGDCALIDFPGLTYEAALDVIPSKRTVPRSWHGSLFADGLDDSGLMYRRNRYYDPATGQFTQEDPLGLAGGMNTYGFANGDPVNSDDPFGLLADGCDPPGSCASSGALVGTVLGAGAGLALTTACASVTFGLCAAAGPELTAVLAGIGTTAGLAIGNSLEARGGSMEPNAAAEGAHTTFVPDAAGRTKKYQDWEPNEPRDPRDPRKFKPGKRFDRDGPAHTNPDGTKVETPHINNPDGTARPPQPDEIPQP